jgi:NAD(P)-dependent dehydrogenase (short-subunit alcohol dehydrogenase family)
MRKMNNMTNKGKVAIVTGAGQGIGLEIALQLAQQGTKVVLNDINDTLSKQAAQFIKQQTDNECIELAGNAGDVAFIQQLVHSAVAHFGSLDMVIANAGITLFGDFLSYCLARYAGQFGRNFLFGASRCKTNDSTRQGRKTSFYVFGNRASGAQKLSSIQHEQSCFRNVGKKFSGRTLRISNYYKYGCTWSYTYRANSWR